MYKKPVHNEKHVLFGSRKIFAYKNSLFTTGRRPPNSMGGRIIMRPMLIKLEPANKLIAAWELVRTRPFVRFLCHR